MVKALMAVACILLGVTTVHSKTYTGSFEYEMSSDKSEDEAKDYAKERALKNAIEKAGVFVTMFARERNFRIEEHEVTVLTVGIAKLKEIKFDRNWRANKLYIKAQVKADIDEKDLEKKIREFRRDRQAYDRTLEDGTEANTKLEENLIFNGFFQVFYFKQKTKTHCI